jgi:hypothetical protein
MALAARGDIASAMKLSYPSQLRNRPDLQSNPAVMRYRGYVISFGDGIFTAYRVRAPRSRRSIGARERSYHIVAQSKDVFRLIARLDQRVGKTAAVRRMAAKIMYALRLAGR